MSEIKEFRGKYFFLSNFFNYRLVFNNQAFLNAESAFQAQKTLDPRVRAGFSNMDPSTAKRRGRQVVLRPDWELIKDQVMYEILVAKFSDPALRQKLLDTGDAKLTEGNDWHDNYWGACDCERCKGKGKNRLGELLERVRKEIREGAK